ncbi:MAG: ABC transporter ATP-binding protein [Actinomycetaceae bacterium]|nr:ABC transporter ATP-binding protein [Actinomycetaceae bacterium]
MTTRPRTARPASLAEPAATSTQAKATGPTQNGSPAKATGPTQNGKRGANFILPSLARIPRRHWASALRGVISATAIGTVILSLGKIIDFATAGRTIPTWLTLVLVGAIVVATLTDGRQRYQQMQATGREEGPLRRNLVAALLRRGPAATREKSGGQVSLATDGVERVARYTGGFMTDIIAAVVGPVTLLVMMAIFLSPLAAIALAVGVTLGLAAIKRFSLSHRDVGAKSRQARGRVAAAYLDAIQGLETLALLRATDRIGAQLAQMGENQRQATMRLLARNQQLLLVIDILITGFLILGSAVFALWLMLMGGLGVGGAAALVALTIIMIEPLEMVGSFFYIAMAGRAIEKRINALVRRYSVTDEGVVAGLGAHPALSAGEVATEGGSRAASGEVAKRAEDSMSAPGIEIENLSFAYPDAHGQGQGRGGHGHGPTHGHGAHGGGQAGGSAVGSKAHGGNGVKPTANTGENAQGREDDKKLSLPPTSLRIKPGEHVAIKAASGAGKSTLLSIICADLPVQSGLLRIGETTYLGEGRDTQSQRSARRQQCAVVAQHSWLFTGSVRDNLAIGAPEASEAQMWQALERAYIADEIRALPHGIDTQVGERGGLLSGGQVQRLALARAFLSGRPILILDEPTSQIDRNSEAHICRALADAGASLTVLMATHRDSSTAGFDRVVRLADLVGAGGEGKDEGRTPADEAAPANPTAPTAPTTPAGQTAPADLAQQEGQTR